MPVMGGDWAIDLMIDRRRSVCLRPLSAIRPLPPIYIRSRVSVRLVTSQPHFVVIKLCTMAHVYVKGDWQAERDLIQESHDIARQIGLNA